MFTTKSDIRRYITVSLAAFLLATGSRTAEGDAPTPTAPVADLYGEAIVKTWVRPVYPPAAAKAKIEGRVEVRFIVDEKGAVSGAHAVGEADQRLVEAALAAVNQWTFEPALENGKPVPICMQCPVVFRLADLKRKKTGIMPGEERPQAAPRIPARVKVQPEADYPEELLGRKLPGRVRLAFTVNTAGRVESPRALGASHPAFILPALAALNRWEFEPAQQGDLKLSSSEDMMMKFSVFKAQRADVYAANGLILADEPPAVPVKGDAPAARRPLPDLLMVFDSVYPYELLLAGTEGEATVEFTVTPAGDVEGLIVRNATQPEFGHMLAAAVQCWKFVPKAVEGSQPPVRLTKRQMFSLPAAGSESRLLAIVSERRPANFSGRGLDEGLRPVYQVSPLYPEALRAERLAGRAEVEFIIDSEGRVRLSRVISATREEFGVAAATAVAQWVFSPPRRGGRPADVKVRLPFDFTAPK